MLKELKKKTNLEKNYISLPYEKVIFLIPREFIIGTFACSENALNLTDWNWDKSNKISYLDKKISYLPFDLVGELFYQNSKSKTDASEIVYSYVKTAIVLKKENFSLLTSSDCSVVNESSIDFNALRGIPKKMLNNLGVKSCCFIDNKMGIVINPIDFFAVVKKKIQGKKI